MGKPDQLHPDHPGKGGGKQAHAGKGKPVDIDKEETDMTEDQDVATYEYGGYAIAGGEDTVTSVESDAVIVDNGPVTRAKINIKATATGSDSADASTDVVSNADISILIHFEQDMLESDGVFYDISNAKFIGISLPDHVNSPGISKKVVIINHGEDANLDPALDGNIAALSVNAQVSGDNTYLSAEVGVLALEDTLSVSALHITAEVA